MLTLRNKMFVVVSLPAGLAAASFYGSAIADGDAVWLFRMGLSLMFIAIVLGRLTWIGHHYELLEDRLAALSRRVDHLDAEQYTIREDVDSHLAVKAWRQAFMSHPSPGGHLRLLRREDH